VNIDQGVDNHPAPDPEVAERYPHRWSPKWWPLTWRLVGWLYALGVIAGSRWHSPGGMRRAYVTVTWRDLRGHCPYVLGWPAWKWHCLLRAHHWPGEYIGLGLCAKCAPAPSAAPPWPPLPAHLPHPQRHPRREVNPMTRSGFLTAQQVADRLAVSPKTVARWSKAGRLAHLRTLGGHRRYDPQMVDRLARQLTQPRPTTRPPNSPRRGANPDPARTDAPRPPSPHSPQRCAGGRMDPASLPDHPVTPEGMPLQHGPFEHQPAETFIAPARRTAMLQAALDGVALGTWDRRILTCLCHWSDTPTFLAILGWVERARHAGPRSQAQGGGGRRC